MYFTSRKNVTQYRYNFEHKGNSKDEVLKISGASKSEDCDIKGLFGERFNTNW